MTELFKDFEVNWEHRWPVVSKLLGGSVVVHLLLVLCLLYIPGVRNAFNIAVLFADARVVDKDYERTVIGDDVQFVQISGNKFRYPDGYWAMEGQPGAMLPLPPTEMVVQSQPVPPLNTTAPPPPALPSPTVTPAPLPSPAASGSPAEVVAKLTPSPSPTPDSQKVEQAQKQLEKVAKENDITLPKEDELNKKPLKDFATYVNDLKNQGKLDLNQPFEIVIESELDKDGRLKNPKFTKKEGDANLGEVFGRFVAALNDSNFLSYLKKINEDKPGTKIVFTIKQGETEVLASVESEVSSEDSARQLAGAFRLLIASGADSRAGKDEEVLLKNTSVEPKGSKLLFNFTMPRQAVLDLFKKQLPAS